MAQAQSTVKAIQNQGRYQPLKLIGKGSYGSVFDAIDTKTGSKIALKVIDLDDMDDDIGDVMQEIATLANCDCEQITKYYHSCMLPDSSKLLISMELMTCSGADLLEVGAWPEKAIAYAMRQILRALEYLHSQGRMHRDIKAANILLNAAGIVKIADFGVSGQLTQTLGYKRKTFVGTPYWMAPEVIESSEEGYSASADIWSLGITAIEMALRHPPHSDLHPMRVLFVIPKADQPKLEGAYSSAFKDFVACCTSKDPLKRPTASQLLKHTFLKVSTPPPALQALIVQSASANGEHSAPEPSMRPATHSGGGEDDPAAPVWDFPDDGAAVQSSLSSLQPPPRSLRSSGALRDSFGGGSDRASRRETANSGAMEGSGALAYGAGRVSENGDSNYEGTVLVKRDAPRPTLQEAFITRTAEDMAARDLPTPAAPSPMSHSARGSLIARSGAYDSGLVSGAPSPSNYTPRELGNVLRQSLQNATLRDVLLPALCQAGCQNEDPDTASPAATQALSDTIDGLSRLEAARPGACMSFVGQLMTAVVAAPIAGAGEVSQLRQFASKLGSAVNIAPDDAATESTALRQFLLQRLRSSTAMREYKSSSISGPLA